MSSTPAIKSGFFLSSGHQTTNALPLPASGVQVLRAAETLQSAPTASSESSSLEGRARVCV